MPQSVQVLALKAHPILQLTVEPPAGAARALALPGQALVKEFHVTLARLDDLEISLGEVSGLPAPPASIELSDELRVVSSPGKTSCYFELSPDSQAALKAFTQDCERVTGSRFLSAARVFHVSVSNACGGDVRASVGAVWAHPSRPV